MCECVCVRGGGGEGLSAIKAGNADFRIEKKLLDFRL